jgi:hypothetical protein
MACRAFNGDPSVKALALDLLTARIDGGAFRYGGPFEPDGATAMQCVAESDDPQDYSERVGFPLPLAVALDEFVSCIVRAKGDGPEYAKAWLADTPVGADLSDVPSFTMWFMLEDDGLRRVACLSDSVERSRREILHLHRRWLDRDLPTPSDWRAVRKAAVAAANAVAGDRLLSGAARTIEAAAWPGDVSSALHDTLRMRGGLDIRLRLAELDWSDEDERRFFGLMESNDDRVDVPPGPDRAYAILDLDDRTFGAKCRRRIACFSMPGAGWAAANFVLEALSTARVPGHSG